MQEASAAPKNDNESIAEMRNNIETSSAPADGSRCFHFGNSRPTATIHNTGPADGIGITEHGFQFGRAMPPFGGRGSAAPSHGISSVSFSGFPFGEVKTSTSALPPAKEPKGGQPDQSNNTQTLALTSASAAPKINKEPIFQSSNKFVTAVPDDTKQPTISVAPGATNTPIAAPSHKGAPTAARLSSPPRAFQDNSDGVELLKDCVDDKFKGIQVLLLENGKLRYQFNGQHVFDAEPCRPRNVKGVRTNELYCKNCLKQILKSDTKPCKTHEITTEEP
jgi:hypothetical protein